MFQVIESVVLACKFTTGNVKLAACPADQLNILVVTCNKYLYLSIDTALLNVNFNLN